MSSGASIGVGIGGFVIAEAIPVSHSALSVMWKSSLTHSFIVLLDIAISSLGCLFHTACCTCHFDGNGFLLLLTCFNSADHYPDDTLAVGLCLIQKGQPHPEARVGIPCLDDPHRTLVSCRSECMLVEFYADLSLAILTAKSLLVRMLQSSLSSTSMPLERSLPPSAALTST